MKFSLLTIAATFGMTALTIAQNVPNNVPTNGLVGWWPFTGNANDESGNGNHAVVNAALLTSDRTGNGLYFVHIIDPQGNTIDIKKIVLQ